ncbi:MAG: hypothetical protein KIT58_08065, partial [Planctomycetota bacterium]|nr:hypothetical protein [Planctomycetota bacterium]
MDVDIRTSDGRCEPVRGLALAGVVALVVALVGCLGPRVDATPEQAERLTLALVRALRLHHDLHTGAAP